MRKLTYLLLLLYVCIVLGVAIELPGALGSAIRLSQTAALFVWLLSLVTVTHRIRRLHPLQVTSGVLILWNLSTYLWSMDPAETLLHFARSVMVFTMSVALYDVFRTTRQERGLRQAIVVAGYILVGICVYNFRSGAGKELDESRFSAGALDPNDMGLILAVIIPLAWQLLLEQLEQRGRWRPLTFLNLLYPVAALGGIMLSGSRGSIVAALPGLIFIACSYRRLPTTLRLVIPLLLCASLPFAAKSSLSRNDSIAKNIARLSSVAGSASDDNLSGRTEIWAAGWDVFVHHPFVGVGSGAFPESTRRYPVPRHPITGDPYVAHNTYLSLLTETGIVGFALFAAAVFVALRSVWAMESSQRWGWLVAIASLLIGITTLSWDFRSYIWIFLTAAVISSTAVREARQAARSTAAAIPLPLANERKRARRAALSAPTN